VAALKAVWEEDMSFPKALQVIDGLKTKLQKQS